MDLNWEIDLFGRVRRSYEAARAEVQAIEADYHNMMLSVTANVASTYFMIRSLDAQIDVLVTTIHARQESLHLATERLEAGLTDELDVARARADLANTEANLFSIRANREETENSLATLLGQPASAMRLAHHPTPEHGAPPRVPAGLPSRMLERRPDVAAAERSLASANAQIGVAIAAFYPQVKLTGAAGFESADIGSLFAWPARFWQIGPSVTIPIFEGGRNVANLAIAKARYEENVAQYRGRVLTAFQDVENALSGLRNLAGQAEAEDRAVDAARRSLQLSQDKYNKGASTYLDVLDAQRTLLQYEQTSAQLVGQRLQTTVQLIKALGGDWN